MKSDVPKQYIEVCGKPIISWTLGCIDFSLFCEAVIVVSDSFRDFVSGICKSDFPEQRFLFAPAGSSRQESILNGLMALRDYAGPYDLAVIHDAARPCLSKDLLRRLLSACEGHDGAMPVLPVKDTVYQSDDGSEISSLLDRDRLFLGQSPEAFRFGRYLEINEGLESEELSKVRGSSEIAFRNGMKIALVDGDEANFKITTPADLERFAEIQAREAES